ncbi:MAG: aminotransferase class III-fold pyridoxal phosphate-dependent enzyme, partial [Chthoniobacteraceae bacterium]
LGCAMALASMRIHGDTEIARTVREKGAKLKTALRAIQSPHIGDVRGIGLMLGVELTEPGKNAPATTLALSIVKRALRDGIILLSDSPTANVLSFTPSFCISDEEIAFIAAWLENALANGKWTFQLR